MPIPITTAVVPDHGEVLRQLVHDRLYSELRDHQLIKITDSEYAYVVRWVRPEIRESGTHRVLLPTEKTRDQEPLITWGHYFRSEDHETLSLRDYLHLCGYAKAEKLKKIEH